MQTNRRIQPFLYGATPNQRRSQRLRSGRGGPPSSHSNAQRKGCRSRGGCLQPNRRIQPFLYGATPNQRRSQRLRSGRGGPPSSRSNAQRKGCRSRGAACRPTGGYSPSSMGRRPISEEANGFGAGAAAPLHLTAFPLWGDAPSAKKPTASERARRPPFISQQRAEERL